MSLLYETNRPGRKNNIFKYFCKNKYKTFCLIFVSSLKFGFEAEHAENKVFSKWDKSLFVGFVSYLARQ